MCKINRVFQLNVDRDRAIQKIPPEITAIQVTIIKISVYTTNCDNVCMQEINVHSIYVS